MTYEKDVKVISKLRSIIHSQTLLPQPSALAFLCLETLHPDFLMVVPLFSSSVCQMSLNQRGLL